MDTATNENTVVSIIAHDLKDPLNAIFSISEILLHNWDEITENDKISFIEDIHKSCNRTRMLLEDLLIWSKGIANNFKPFKKNFNIKELLEKNLEFAYMNAASQGIKINNNVENDINVNADENMISTVLRNLIANAIKYIEPGGEVEISATQTNGFCTISISDNGKGICDPQILKLFNENSTDPLLKVPDYKRKGLGLILCKDFVIRNEGKIWFESEKDQGTKFYFTLPLI